MMDMVEHLKKEDIKQKIKDKCYIIIENSKF